MKLHAILTPILAAALASGCASTQLRYDNNSINRGGLVRSGPQQSLGIVASLESREAAGHDDRWAAT